MLKFTAHIHPYGVVGPHQCDVRVKFSDAPERLQRSRIRIFGRFTTKGYGSLFFAFLSLGGFEFR